MIRRIAFLAYIGILPFSSAQAANWYVDSTYGNDSNDGLSLGTPFLTLQHANDAGMVAGDRMVIRGGGKPYCGGSGGGSCLNLSVSGTYSDGVCTKTTTIMAYPSDPMPIIAGTRNLATIYGGGLHCVTINGLELAGWNGALTLAGAWTNASGATATSSGTYNGSGITLDDGVAPTNQTASGATATGQSVIATSTNPVSGGVIVGDVAFDSTHTTALAAGTTVTAVSSSSVTVTPALTSPGISNADTLKFWHAPHHITITGNKVHDYPCAGISLERADYMTITGNWSYNNALYSPLACSGISPVFDYAIDQVTTSKNTISGNIAWGNVDLIANHSASTTGTTNGTTVAGNNTLHFASTPGGITVGQQIYDTTTGNSGAILAGTTVVSTTGTTVVMSNNAQTGSGSGVGNGDTFLFASITDGEGIFIDENNNDVISYLPYVGRTTVQNNIAVGNGNCGVCSYHSNHVDFSFNTSAFNQVNLGQGEMSDSQGTDTTMGNNILVSSGSTNPVLPDLSTSTTTYSSNLCNGGNGTCSGTGNVTAPVLFVAPTTTMPVPSFPVSITAFQLQPTSPAIDAATGSFTRSFDILGNIGQVGPSYDIGAYESPCSGFGTGTISNTASLVSTQFQDGQVARSITPGRMRNLIVTLACFAHPG